MKSANILVVDDEPSVRRYMQTLLEADAYQVETVGSGLQALERVKQETGLPLLTAST